MLDPAKTPATLSELAQRSFVNFATRPCLGAKNRESKNYEYLTYEQVAQKVRAFAMGLRQLGVERGDRVAILSENRPEWAICDFACQMLGAISVPMFSTLPGVQIGGILRDCSAKIVVVSDLSQLKKVHEVRESLTACQHVIAMETDAAQSANSGAQSWETVESNGHKYLQEHAIEFETMWPAAQPEDIATIIYTSGTTGEPKGVMLSHQNLTSNAEAIADLLRANYDFEQGERFLSFLPLAHIFERTAGFWVPIRLGCAIAYTESLRTVDKNLREVQPGFMFCVPRFYETLAEKLEAHAQTLPENKRDKYLHALQLARKHGANIGGIPNSPSLNLIEKIQRFIYEKAVYSKIRERFGGELKAFVSGGAPMPPDIAALFIGLGITILEGYGLTETSPVIAVNLPNRIRIGTVGEVLPNVQLKIEGDGEICVRGPSITRGYWEREIETRESISEDGWFSTGDIGVLETVGDRKYLRITDRKKDLLVLANGKKVAPAPIEMRLAQSSFIAQVVLLGDKQKAVSALIVPQMEALRLFAAKQNLGLETDDAILQSPAILKRVREEIDNQSKDLADFEKIKKFTLLPTAFSVESGELTPTLKVKRRVVAEKYGALVEA